MKSGLVLRAVIGSTLGLGVWQVALVSLPDQALANPPTPEEASLRPGAAYGPEGAPVSLALPPAPAIKSPVGFFRELLAVSPEEREQLLANRPPGNRKSLETKLREYESLTPEERELRLQATDLRWHLLWLMRTAPTNRVEPLAATPEPMRKLIEPRLVWWDKLSPEEQDEFLENDMAIQYLLRFESSTPEQQNALRETLPPERLSKLEADLELWRSRGPEQRRQMTERFNEFFDLTPAEKERTLNLLSDAERKQMEKTLQSFVKMSRSQRTQCINAFRKFANMSPAERQQFLHNVERWQEMSPSERRAWRNLVRQIEQWPPLPPGLDSPPLPPHLPEPAGVKGPAVLTNGN